MIKKVGRPKHWKTPDELMTDFNNYIDYAIANVKDFDRVDFIKAGQKAGEIVNLPAKTWISLESFCVFAGVLKQTFDNYLVRNETEEDKEFFGVANMIRDTVRSAQIDLAANGLADSQLIAMLSNLKQRQDITSNDEAIQIAQISFKTD